MIDLTTSRRAGWMHAAALSPSRAMIRKAAEAIDVKASDITGPMRLRPIAYARFGIMRGLRARGWSLTMIGNALGGRDHTTIISGLRRADGLYRNDPVFSELCDWLVA